jgi:hypothetical protein
VQEKTTSVSHLIAFCIYLDKKKYICTVGTMEDSKTYFLLYFDYLGILRAGILLRLELW